MAKKKTTKKTTAKAKKGRTYTTVRDKLETGDLILFSGKGGTSTGIKWLTNSKWSHVAMVVRLDDWDTLLLWEATTLMDLKDVLTGKCRQGVQLVTLSDRIASYDGEVSVRFLDVKRTPKMKRALVELRQELRGRKYETRKIELLRAAYDGPLGENSSDLSSLFCSELIAESYQRMGLLPSGSKALPSNEYTPRDFSDKGTRMELLLGATLSPELQIER